LDTWLDIVGTGEKKTELGMAEDWNMNKDGELERIIDQ